MKNRIIIATSIALALSSQYATAGPVANPDYIGGETLTFGAMNNIKTAVGDNDGRITAITAAGGPVDTNTTNISNNAADIATASRFYGDGSAGALTIAAGTNWNSIPPAGNNLNFTNVVINAAQTLTVPAGTTIRCNGTFTNNGTINVINNGGNVNTGWSSSTTIGPTVSFRNFPHPGDSFRSPSLGQYNNDSATVAKSLSGGAGGLAISRSVAASSFSNFRFGGGDGAGWTSGGGGGLLKIQCADSIINAGIINALPANVTSVAVGGGGGGIIVLASSTSVNNSTGTINVPGSNGGPSGTFGGAGGGGGGGIIVLVAPTVTSLGGTVNLTGGTGGTNATNATSANRTGGGGGGASGGNGANGGSISSAITGIPSAGVSGLDGYMLEILSNPAHMM